MKKDLKDGTSKWKKKIKNAYLNSKVKRHYSEMELVLKEKKKVKRSLILPC